ncbi:mitochondrial fission ELM1 family protein [Niveispirillum fermenti]|uniref:mitochondrial fission ELM1 family protein n=1 Tax=Niveispirillum fermenti TaxID=1233113 RepID=UPI003A8AA524
MTSKPPTCWVVSDGRAGIENPCLGLAEALDLTPVVKRVRLRTPWRQTTPYLPLPGIAAALAPGSDTLDTPWPDLLISSGRQAVALSMAAGRRSPRTVRVHIQNPGVPFDRFDLVSLPSHDRKKAPNLVESRGAIHRVTARKLARAAADFAPLAAGLARPLVAVMIGGSNRFYTLDEAMMTGLADQLATLVRDQGVGMMITTSRRTGAGNEAILRRALTGLPVFLWDGTGPNPYFGMLALADHLIVTSDSVAMVSEATATGKPVHVIDLAGNAEKFDRFHAMLRADGVTRPFTGRLETWTYTPLDDTARLAARVRELLDERQAGSGAG